MPWRCQITSGEILTVRLNTNSKKVKLVVKIPIGDLGKNLQVQAKRWGNAQVASTKAKSKRGRRKKDWHPSKLAPKLLKPLRKGKKNLKNLLQEGLHVLSWPQMQSNLLTLTRENQFLSGVWGEVVLYCQLRFFFAF
ncbi:hypothetical protein SDJN03_08109, partial [Cucurbita argyrosperma subsp. sororia]